MMRATAKTTLLAAATAACLGMLPSAVLAGTYVITACSPSSAPGSWTATNTFPGAFSVAELCGGAESGSPGATHAGAIYAEDILNSAADIPDGSRAGWSLLAPPATTITAISYYRRLWAYNDQDLVSGLYDANGDAVEECKIPWPFVSGSSNTCSLPNNQTPVTFSGLDTTALFFGVRCRIVRPVSACGAGGAPLHAVQADLFSARVTLSENSAPVVSGVGGGLWSAGVVSGALLVTFAASDPIGIKQQRVSDDAGQELVSTSAD
jgi:hypothetical protein